MKQLFCLVFGLQLWCGSVMAQQWVDFHSSEGKFSIQFPSQPRAQVDTSRIGEVSFVSYLFLSRAASDIFLAGWVDYDSSYRFDTKAELLANRDNFAKAVKAEVYETKDISYNGFPGIEFSAGTSELYISSRIYIVGKRPYQLVALSRTGKVSPDLQKFYSSFVVSK